MKSIKSTLILAMFGGLSVVSGQQETAASGAMEMVMNSATETPAVNAMQTEPTVVGVASRNESFTTLVAALKAADLVTTLDGQGPFTVFAPTNDAFAKLPEGTVPSLLESQNLPTLTKILTYHVVAGDFRAADVVKAIRENNNAFPVQTVAGEILTLGLQDGSVVLTDVAGNTSKITATDVAASNGVIHVIDTVVMPE